MIYFSPSEFRCRCGHCNHSSYPTTPLSKELRAYLDALRLAYGAPIVITSGWRCLSHNRIVGGAAKSDHLSGIAADISAADFGELVSIHRSMWELLPRYHRMYDHIDKDRRYIHISLWGGGINDAEV